ncbi:MAG: HupE/UreJ family protein [Porticoccaceae bacterium]
MCRSFAVFALLVLALVGPVSADDARPVLVSVASIGVSEGGEPSYQLLFKVPNSGRLAQPPELILPASCRWQSERKEYRSDSIVQRGIVTCAGSLLGQTLSLDYPQPNPGLFTLFRLSGENGEALTAELLRPDQLSWQLSGRAVPSNVLLDYLILGVEHIWKGIDHLLFVSCLVLLTLPNWRRLLLTITGFTAAHSVTLALAAVDWVRLPIAPVEAVIALSVLFLAVELARDQRDSLTFRQPLVVSVAFGLLHGFGFAAVLQEIGLPEQQFVTALLGFNVGVEVGQLLFIGALMALFALLTGVATLIRPSQFSGGGWQKLTEPPQGWVRSGALYATGGLAALWVFERVAQFPGWNLLLA